MLKNITWTFSANVLAAFFKWLLLILIAQWLTPAAVGKYALAVAIVSPLTLFANMKLRMLYVSDRQNDYKNYVVARNSVAVAVFISLIVISAIFYNQILLILLLVALSKLLELVTDLMYALAHKQNDMSYLAKNTIIKQLLLIGSFAIALYMTKDLTNALWIQLIVQTTYLFIEYTLFVKKYAFSNGRTTIRIKQLLSIGIPLGITQLIISFNSFLPRYVLERVSTYEEVGYFSAVAYVTVIVNIVIGALAQNYLTIFKKDFHRADYEKINSRFVTQLVVISVTFTVCYSVAAFFLGERLLIIVYGESYGDYAFLLIIMAICVLFNALNWSIDTVFMSIGLLKNQLPIAIITLLLTAPFTVVCVYSQGLLGAALAMGINSSILYMCKYIYYKYWYKRLVRR